MIPTSIQNAGDVVFVADVLRSDKIPSLPDRIENTKWVWER